MSDLTQAASGGAIAALAALKSGLSNVRAAIPSAGGVPFLKMGKDGKWTYGSDDVEVASDQVFAANPMGIQHGWIAWKEREQDSKEPAQLLGERMVPMFQDKPALEDLPAVIGGKWSSQLAIPMKGVGGDDNGVEVLYKVNSIGGNNACAALIDEIIQQVALGVAEVVPLFTLGNDTYKHPAYGKLYTPEFDITGWVTMDGPAADKTAQAVTSTGGSAEAEATLAEAPVAATAEVGAAPAEPEAGTRRRRRA